MNNITLDKISRQHVITNKNYSYPFSVAPMLDWTDRHCRYFHRLLSKQSLLYTEMITTGAILQGKRDYLRFNDNEAPVAVQFGGNDPNALAACAQLAQKRGYSEINLNVGCPSDRVQNGAFGACLMAKPQQVATCLDAMKNAVNIPITVKIRLGINHNDSYEFLCQFIEATMAFTGTYIIHARKAWLQGLSPKENRTIPPLDYNRVYRIKQQYPHLAIILNGGIKTLAETRMHLQRVDGVMLGREVYYTPSLLMAVDHTLFGKTAQAVSRKEIIRSLYPYIEAMKVEGVPLHAIIRHTLGLFNGCRGARLWRRYLSEHAHNANAGCALIEEALSLVDEDNPGTD